MDSASCITSTSTPSNLMTCIKVNGDCKNSESEYIEIESPEEITGLDKSKVTNKLPSMPVKNVTGHENNILTNSNKSSKCDNVLVPTQAELSVENRTDIENKNKPSLINKNSGVLIVEDSDSSSSFSDSSASTSATSDSESESSSESVGKLKVNQCSSSQNNSTTSKSEKIDVITNTVTSNNVPKKLVLLNSIKGSIDKETSKTNTLKYGSNVYVINGDVLNNKDTLKSMEEAKTGVNIICVSNNLEDIIKKMECDGDVKPGLVNSLLKASKEVASADKNENSNSQTTDNLPFKVNNLSSLINSLKCVQSPESTSSVTLSDLNKLLSSKGIKRNYEILRNKLSEKNNSDSNQADESFFDGAKSCWSFGQKKECVKTDSPAIIRARNEFLKCKNLLIEAATRAQVPKYAPPPYYKGPTFSCEECSDTFTNTVGLSNHKNRRSVLFTYACPICKRTMEFFNRCTFLLHVRSHDSPVKACFLTISTIPANKLNFRVLDYHKDKNETTGHGSAIETRITENEELAAVSETNVTDKKKSSRSLKNMRILKASKKKKITKLFDLPMSNNVETKTISSCDTSFETTKVPVPVAASGNTSENTKLALAVANPTLEDTTGNASGSNVIDITNCSPEDKSKSPPLSFKTKRKLQTVDVFDTDDGQSNEKKKLSVAPKKPRLILPKLTSNDEEDVDESKDPAISPPKAGKHSSVLNRRPDPRLTPKTVNASAEKQFHDIVLSSSSDNDDEETETRNQEYRPVVCRDCRKEVPNLPRHYRAENRPLKEFACDACKWFNPSQCALEAHVRTHSKAQPYICPDCGFYFSTQESFLVHVNRVCYYEAKIIRFQCPACSALKASVPQFADHLKQYHTREVYKCSVCITSSYSLPVVEAHMEKMHPGKSTNTVLEGFRCMLCPSVLVSKSSIILHINKHVYNLQYLRYVYMCKRCKQYANGRLKKFIAHNERCTGTETDSSLRGNDKPGKSGVGSLTANINKSKTVPRKSSVKCKNNEVHDVEEKDPLSVEDWEADKLKAEFVPKTKICVMCQSTVIEENSRSLFCKACVRYVNAEDGVNGSTSESDVMSANANLDSGKRPKRKFKCKLCKQFMNRDWATITRHYEEDHQSDFDVRVGVRRKSSETKNQSESSSRRKSSVASGGGSGKSPKTESSKYKCVKCGHASNDRTLFRTHIAAHKLEKDYQCMECGECFIVKPSLEKHLIVAHNIRNTKEYFEENCKKANKGEKCEEKQVAENQCEVCFLQCDSKQNYDKHIRTHGMAFLSIQSRVKSSKNSSTS